MLEPLPLTRIVSTNAALDNATFPADAIVLRTAPDEALVISNGESAVDDPHAIIVADTGWCGTRMPIADAQAFLDRNCSWDLPSERPAFAQGRVADAPVKLWIEGEHVLFVVPHVAAHDLAERMSR